MVLEQQIFGDNYIVKKVLGEGSFGIVYLCQDRTLNRPVALKVLRREVAQQRELARFLTEARRLASLTHENVVRVYYLDETVPFIVMEYVPGQTLRQIQKVMALSPQRTLNIMIQVVQGLAALHDLGIVHRDLSTSNIMVAGNNSTKILDLGLARDAGRMSASTTDGNIAGTTKYVAPEVIDGEKAAPASDVFSFGVILYELLSGHHPFEAEHFMSIFYNIVERRHRPLHRLVPHLPIALSSILDRCLAKDPNERLTDLNVIAEQLRSTLAESKLREPRPQISVPHTPPQQLRFRNPYLNRLMIQRASDFYGRKQEVKRIYSRLNGTPLGSVSVVGDRKIGKSSLLNHVYMRKHRRRYLDDADSTIMVYVDFQRQDVEMTVEVFVDAVLGLANLELRDQLDVSACSRDLAGIRECVNQLHQAGYRLVLLMDEFEAITANPNFDLKFFSFLRFLANHHPVAYVTSSARDLQQLCHTQEIRDSPFFNIFTPLSLTVFERDEALDLIRKPSSDVGHSLEPYEEQILGIAGLFPFFLQIACSHAIECAEENPHQDLDVAEVRRRFYREARLHYRFMWDTFDHHERSAIRRVAEGSGIPSSLRHVCEELERKHYLEPDAGQHRLFSASFQGFVESELVPARRNSLLRRLFGRGGRA